MGVPREAVYPLLPFFEYKAAYWATLLDLGGGALEDPRPPAGEGHLGPSLEDHGIP
ncbi:hypothetical protein TthAA37_21670 (plasmid) [Thermus thermophilus]|uniref:Uncharacterized protein n=1 Tax=Thermus thermophilus TaxID=274 RepID=A0AAD1NZ35_THETH|nr:hypothetical protein TthAA220_20620 [Thermus thermophilus]BBL85804.1 hypothetical protein TthAA229_22850 [Thermus thermophilus]BCZ87954.1 hypothetical protein TthAA11_21360 [Thermus thermophilus]BCZ92978.1 hypothetical protein TthAA37_21670 [Thermus thermophilus]BCZ95597.1 hypothetical protein TthAK1_22140 [Thermus thermophilus]